jgi:hypothetical protein
MRLRWNQLRRQHKPQRKQTLRGGVDPREAQRRSVEARRRNKRAQEVAPSDSHGLDGRKFSARRPRIWDSKHLEIEPQTRQVLPENKAPTTVDLLREIDVASPRPAKPEPSGDIFHDFPREANEPTNDYYLRHALHQQEKWRKIQERNGTGPVVYPWPTL